MAAKGIKFFGTDWNANVFSPTITVSSRDNLKQFMFDGLKSTRWTSESEGTDGNAVSVEVDYGANRTFDSFYVWKTNIDDIEIDYWNGAAWINVSDVTKDSTGYYVYAKLSAPVTATKVRITGSNTIVADQEKYVYLFWTFQEIGQFEYFPDVKAQIDSDQENFILENAKSFIIDKGEAFSCQLVFKSHVNQNDIDVYTELREWKLPFYIWVNGGDESIFSYKFEPYRFKDIYKVALVGKANPALTGNYYKSGLNDKITLTEVS
jgi:hypothetical protein